MYKRKLFLTDIWQDCLQSCSVASESTNSIFYVDSTMQQKIVSITVLWFFCNFMVLIIIVLFIFMKHQYFGKYLGQEHFRTSIIYYETLV